jgi:hypothetical protein
MSGLNTKGLASNQPTLPVPLGVFHLPEVDITTA